MNEYQTITIKGYNEEILVGSTEYPFQQTGILYLKFITYKKVMDPDDDQAIYDPRSFIILQPQDIIKREYAYTKDEENMLIDATNEARDREVMMREFAEEEMKQKMEVIKDRETEPVQDQDDDDDVIDSDFRTELDVNDPSFG